MSLSNRRTVLSALMLGGGLGLSGCFRPMLAEDSAAADIAGRIALPVVDGRFGYFLTKSLEERLGVPSDLKWTLTVSHQVRSSGLAVAQDNSVTRITLTATADWFLKDRSTGAVVLQDQTVSRSGYNATTSLFATRQAEQDVRRRLARDLGERIARRIQANAEDLNA